MTSLDDRGRGGAAGQLAGDLVDRAGEEQEERAGGDRPEHDDAGQDPADEETR